MITQNIIGYELSGKSAKRIYAADPAAGTTLPEEFYPATSEEVDLALTKAKSAWYELRFMEGKQKALFLQKIAEGIEALEDQLINRIKLETAYPEARIITERNRTCAQLRMYAEVAEKEEWRDITIDPALPERNPLPRPELRRMMMSIGPVIVFGASNFPLAYSTAGGDVTSALAAGCPVIVKAHDSHLGTNALVAEVIMKAAQDSGMPDGVFSSLNGDGFETGNKLVQHQLTAAVGFTGSLAGGRALFDLGQKREVPIPVFAEMGSVNPVFLLPGKIKEDVKSLVPMLSASMTTTLGQFCTKPGILVAVENDQIKNFVNSLREHLEKTPEGTLLNKNIQKSFHKGVASIREEKSVQMILDPSGDYDKVASPVLAIVAADIFLRHTHLHLEIFGPFSLLVLCQNQEQMLEVAKAMEGQLTSTIHANDDDHSAAKELMNILLEKAGRIIFNGVPTGVEVVDSMTHGGPYPSSTDYRFTAVGHAAIRRWVRPLTFQNFPPELLPDLLKR